MSHFTCLVIGQDPEKQLAPYEESLHVEWVDTTQEHLDEYETGITKNFYCSSGSSWGMEITQEQFELIKNNPIGTNLKLEIKRNNWGYYKVGSCYKGYYRLPEHKRCDGNAWFKVTKFVVNKHWDPNSDALFEGIIMINVIEPPVEIPIKLKYPKYEDYLINYHGIILGEKQGYWNNPNAKWDWYKIGGRWCGFFKGVNGKIGDPGLNTPKAKPGYFDQILKKDVDFVGMRRQKEDQAAELYDKIISIVGEYEPQIPWSELLKTIFVTEGRDKAIEFYNTQPRLIAFSEYNKLNNGEYFDIELDDFIKSREEYISSCGNRAGIPFAVVKDGKWYEKGTMGWWGSVSNEVDQETWNAKVTEMINSLPSNTLLTLVDCHI